MGNGERTNAFLRWRRMNNVEPYDLVDGYGRVIGVGDVVILGTSSVAWRVQSIKPDLTPRGPDAPKCLVQVTLVAVNAELVEGGKPAMNYIKVRDASEFPQPPTDDRQGQEKEPPPS